MEIRPLTIDGAWLVTPRHHGDDPGLFLEWYQAETFAAAVGRPFPLAQSNISISGRGVVRGIHLVDLPPGQDKYITCVSGAVLDVVVDLRLGSPTFGRWEAVRLDDANRHAVHLDAGLGHAFCALTEPATVVYLCSSPYDPAAERTVNPMDPDLAIDWPEGPLRMSPRDAGAPSVAQARQAGVLPAYVPRHPGR
ncbi:dTDP-4-dehydrorhamnose 3,5-epimerase family protein [Micromonospora sp. NPDC051296]|uniref:dTDP-4-dehydrorhamnose 3,5-epimerase family protein n=1 Tax=Micromonospora sp. NPDC051296 TaxID=3155046 RepID=UPI00343790F7